MPGDDQITAMVQDPDFAKLSVADQQRALSAHDPMFSKAGPSDITRFIQAHQAGPKLPVAPTPQVDMKFALTPKSVLGAVTHDPAYAPGSMSPLQALGAVGTGAAIGSTAGGVYAAPAATALGLGGAYAGGKVGREVGGWAGHPELGAAIGGLAGGFAGPTAMSRFTGEGGALGGLIRALRGETAEAAAPTEQQIFSRARAEALKAGQTAPGPWHPSAARAPGAPKIAKVPGKTSTFTVEYPELTEAGIPKVQQAQPSEVQFVKQFEQPEPSRIQTPGSPTPGQKVTFQSYDRGDLVKMVRDAKTPYTKRIQALIELKRSPGDVPKETVDNLSKYMLEEGAPAIPWRNLKK